MSDLAQSITNATTGLDRYRSTNQYHSMVRSGKIEQTGRYEDLVKMRGHRPIKNTWDAKHLDQFLDNSEFASSIRMNRSHSQVPSNIDRNSTRAFKPGTRFPPDWEVSYLFNLMKDFSVKDPRLDVNSMVMLKEPAENMAEQHYNNKFKTPEKQYSQALLDYREQPSTLSSPEVQKRQQAEVKENQLRFKEWRMKFMEINRRDRLYKSNYRSGVLGIDNPARDETLIYKERKDILDKIQAEREKIRSKRLGSIGGIHNTSTAVEFHNPKYDLNTSLPPTRVADFNRKGFVKMDFVEDKKDSYNRIFQGVDPYHEKYSVPRAQFLLNKESLGKDFDPITGAKKVITIKRIAPGEPAMNRRQTFII